MMCYDTITKPNYVKDIPPQVLRERINELLFELDVYIISRKDMTKLLEEQNEAEVIKELKFQNLQFTKLTRVANSLGLKTR